MTDPSLVERLEALAAVPASEMRREQYEAAAAEAFHALPAILAALRDAEAAQQAFRKSSNDPQLQAQQWALFRETNRPVLGVEDDGYVAGTGCPDCKGTGIDMSDGGHLRCRSCNGSGDAAGADR
jgi:hypothetical protein